MHDPRFFLRALVVAVLVPVMAVPVAEAATFPLPDAPAPQSAPAAQAAPDQPQSAPANGAPTGQNGAAPQGGGAQSTAPVEPQNEPPTGIGTAAAPVENPVGVAASKPAGAAIAPAKQRRTRSFSIRIALLVGAAIGVGTVVALSEASSSRPH